MTSAKTKTLISAVIGIILLLLISTVIYSLFTVSKIKSDLTIQVQTRTFIIKLKDNLTYLLDAETNERGFIITNDTNFLRPYQHALQNISSNITELRLHTKNNSHQQKNLDSLKHFIDLKLERIVKLITLKKRGDEMTLKQMLIGDEGKSFMDNIRRINSAMRNHEEKLFADRQANTDSSIGTANSVFIAEGIFSLLAILFLAIIIIKELNRRTRTENQLREFNIELERKNTEIEQFAFIASHDLQQPLRTISNFTGLLVQKSESILDDTAKKYINYVSTAAGRMSQLIFDLLEYSRIGKELQKTKVDCNLLVDEILKDMDAAIRSSGATISVGKLPVVDGYIYLKSLFQNLLSNAIKYSKKNEPPVVTISATERKHEFLFSVKDNGIGISKEYHDRIFIIFQRLHTRTEYEGTGIGLSQCKKIVELHGGKIWVKSDPGKGSTFIFTIPKL